MSSRDEMLRRRKGGQFSYQPGFLVLLLLSSTCSLCGFRFNTRPYHTPDAELSKDQVVQLNTEQFIVPEVLFQPGLVGRSKARSGSQAAQPRSH